MRRWFPVLALAVMASCSAPQVYQDVRDESPSPDLGRSAWVRYPARVGAWIGTVGGAVASIALLPVTWPIAQLADEPLGYAKDEFMFLPVSAGAGFGNFVFGAPLDALDFVFYRAWTDDHRATTYDYEFQPAPQPPGVGGATTKIER